jgi:SnoaL-like domain
MSTPDHAAQDELLDRLFAGIGERNIDAVAALYARDVEVWHNATGRVLSRAQSLEVLRSFLGRTEAARYEILERRHWDGGAMQRHILHICVGGADGAIDVCITFAFAGGHITRVFEYVDGRALAPLGW